MDDDQQAAARPARDGTPPPEGRLAHNELAARTINDAIEAGRLSRAEATVAGPGPGSPVITTRGVPAMAFELDATPESVPRARAWMRAFAGEHCASPDDDARIAHAFTEAFTNAVRHAYAEPGGTVRVAADVDDGTLEIVIDYDGHGLRAAPGSRLGLGAGLKIIAEAADAFGIRERTPNGTEVWMRFELGS